MWADGTGWDHATPLARGVPCLVATRQFNSQLEDESAKRILGGGVYVSPTSSGPGSADTHTACVKRPKIQ